MTEKNPAAGEIRDYVQHKAGCPKADTWRSAHIRHFEWHDGAEDWPFPRCGHWGCEAWAAAGEHGHVPCTCGLDALLQSPPPDAGVSRALLKAAKWAMRHLRGHVSFGASGDAFDRVSGRELVGFVPKWNEAEKAIVAAERAAMQPPPDAGAVIQEMQKALTYTPPPGPPDPPKPRVCPHGHTLTWMGPLYALCDGNDLLLLWELVPGTACSGAKVREVVEPVALDLAHRVREARKVLAALHPPTKER